MFCDLVGSTALSLQLDPEDVREIVKHVQETCARIIGEYDGFIAKYMGDGILAYFGYPQAHEDDAARALRSGLAIVDAIRARGTLAERFGAQVAVRVGIATGLVVAGDLIGEGASQEKAVVGSTPNLAARLQGLAAPNSVVIASTTRQVLGSQFDLEDLGRHALKGFSQPEQAWRVVGVRTTPTRFEATHASGLTPLVGREAEIDLILHRWRHQAVNGEGQLVLLSGEPGIGKSRLIEAIRECFAGEAYFHICYQCSPYFANSAFYPVVEQLRLAAGLARDDDDEHRLEKIEAMLALAIGDVRQVAPLFAALMEISTGDRYPCLALSPAQQKDRTVSALLEQLQGLARQQPVLFVVEDMQWIDPSTLDFVDQVIEHIEGLRVLCLASSRPDFVPPWIGKPHVTQLFLSRMNRQQCAAIIGRLTRGKKLPAEIEQEIIAKTDGIPLFIEELTKAVLEAGFLDEKADAYQPTTTRPALTVPTTLRDSLMARLDRLGSAKAVAQTGAVIGRTFSLELLAAASGVPTNILEASLAQLVRTELIQQRGAPPLAIYTFGHALIQEVAYQSLLKSRRRHLHAKIARALECHFPEVKRTKPELLAHHATEAGLVELAIGYWQRAGERAAERSANKEAVAHLQKGLELVRLLPEGEGQRQRELDLLVALGVPLRAVKGISAKEVGECYERARQLCEEIGAVEILFPVLWGLWAFFRGHGEMKRAHDLAWQLNLIAEQTPDTVLHLQARHALWTSALFSANWSEAVRYAREGLALYDAHQHHASAGRYGGHDPGICAHGIGAMGLWFIGQPDTALDMSLAGIRLAENLGHRVSLAHAFEFGGILRVLRREIDILEEYANTVVAVGEELEEDRYQATGSLLAAWALSQRDRVVETHARIEVGLNFLRTTGFIMPAPFYLGIAAEAYGHSGAPADGLRLIEEALSAVESSGVRFWEPELYRLKGELSLQLSNDNGENAEACFRQALAVAQTQHAVSLELRAAISLARLRKRQGQRDNTRELIGSALGAFSEGFDTHDLRQARASLEAWSQER